jgi:hypothetical protein
MDNEYLVEEIRINRAELRAMGDQNQTEHREIMNLLGGKVGRGELFGWLSSVATIVGLLILFL